jgi:hypothetical protein
MDDILLKLKFVFERSLEPLEDRYQFCLARVRKNFRDFMNFYEPSTRALFLVDFWAGGGKNDPFTKNIGKFLVEFYLTVPAFLFTNS